MKKRNPYAKELEDPKFRSRIKESKKRYSRNREKKEVRDELTRSRKDGDDDRHRNA